MNTQINPKTILKYETPSMEEFAKIFNESKPEREFVFHSGPEGHRMLNEAIRKEAKNYLNTLTERENAKLMWTPSNNIVLKSRQSRRSLKARENTLRSYFRQIETKNDYWDVLNAEAGKALRVRPRAFITLYETTKQNGVSLFVNKGIPTYVDDLEIYLDIDKDSTIESITEQLKGTPGIQSIKIL